MSRLVDYCPSSDDEASTTAMFPKTPMIKHTKQIDDMEVATPMNKRDLIPKSTAKPSTRRVRKLGGVSQFAENPLFRPWNLQELNSPRRETKLTQQRSPKKLSGVSELDTSQDVHGTLARNLPQTPELKIPTLYATSPNLSLGLEETTELRGSDETFSTQLTSNLADRLKRTFGGSRQISGSSPTKKAQDNYLMTENSRLFDDFNVTGTIFEERTETGRSRPSTAESSYTELNDSKNGTSAIWQDSDSQLSDMPEITLLLDSQIMTSQNTNTTNRMRSFDLTPSRKLLGPKSLSFANRENMDTILDVSSDEEDASTENSLDAALAQQFEEDCRLKSPPQTPTKSLSSKSLQSPLKHTSIPATPHRHNNENFWSQEVTDKWNDHHSPQKPTISSPSKPKRELGQTKAAKTAFESTKHEVGTTFLNELDQTITNGKIAELTESTGGVSLIWSKTLNTTAGRANWKREKIRPESSDIQPEEVQYKHHASIELAGKVIDDETRLLNVIAHEFCHLANFMINGITNNPHGKEFKVWAAKCSREFAHRGIEVTTKHTYDIDFKYVWQCTTCQGEHKRHSRSINPEKHRCGKCKGTLEQIKPVPRKNNAGPSEYQIFIKEQMKQLKLDNPNSPPKDIMKMAAALWKTRAVPEEKETSGGSNEATNIDGILGQLVGLTLDEISSD